MLNHRTCLRSREKTQAQGRHERKTASGTQGLLGIPLRNTLVTRRNRPDRYTCRPLSQRARYHHEIRVRSRSI
jgi:hypothetical protein